MPNSWSPHGGVGDGAPDDAAGSEWHGNDFDDDRGYDLDGDGCGDIPHIQRRLAGPLRATRPELDFFSGFPAMFLVNAMAAMLPLDAPHETIWTASTLPRGQRLDAPVAFAANGASRFR